MISSKSIALGVIGGGSIRTENDSFRFNLGPGEDGKYHEITAIGMDSVTAGFGEYDLKEVIKEYKSSAPISHNYIKDITQSILTLC